MKKTIVVVGAGKGLGNGVAEKFGSNGFRVVLMARNGEHLKEYASDFTEKGIEVYTQAEDLRSSLMQAICRSPWIKRRSGQWFRRSHLY